MTITIVSNIEWDEDKCDEGEQINNLLPEAFVFTGDIEDNKITDWFSDQYGFRVKKFSVERRKL